MPQIHMTPFTAAFAERSPYLLRKEKEREGESERAEKRRVPTAQISNLPPPPPPPPPNTQQQLPPQIRCAPKTPPRLQTTELPATHTLAEGARKLRGREGRGACSKQLLRRTATLHKLLFWRSSVEESSGILF
uniref:putative Polycomb group protein ASXL3 n=1 Tax=Lonchura striata TaxID=40157 RepID=UPI000B4CE7B7|nr:putative Polycomb group protein ASXL3 [Lonchura striata domestica]